MDAALTMYVLAVGLVLLGLGIGGLWPSGFGAWLAEVKFSYDQRLQLLRNRWPK